MKEKEIENTEEINNNDFAGYSTSSKILLFVLFFFIGIINHLGTILVMTGGRLLTIELNMRPYVPIYTSVATVFSIITRMVNSKLCLKVSYKKRVIIICFWMILGYSTMFLVLTFHDITSNKYNILCFILSFVPCFFLGAAYAFGEGVMIAYLRLFPKTLIAGWSSGTGLSGIIGGGLNLLTQLLNGLTLKFLYLILTPLGIVYVFLFLATFKLLIKDHDSLIEEIISRDIDKLEEDQNGKDNDEKSHEDNNYKSIIIKKNNENIEEKSKENNDDTNDENNNEKTEEESKDEKNNEESKNDEEKKNEKNDDNNDDNKKINEAKNVDEINNETNDNKDKEKNEIEIEKEIEEIKEAQTLEDMNIKNKTFSLENFKAVMKMCGRVIINLGFIYFTQFTCVNSVVIRNSNKIDIPFLPISKNDDKLVRKGKFEFINMFFQLGMFTSKTFIKIVRKIQPIEVYTCAITIITIIYLIEYYTGFLPWWCFPIINYILGFFSGGTYAGGFYVILHSGQVLLDYKELTVNIATIFNDTGTFMSGLVGYWLFNYIINNDEPFPGQEIKQ